MKRIRNRETAEIARQLQIQIKGLEQGSIILQSTDQIKRVNFGQKWEKLDHVVSESDAR